MNRYSIRWFLAPTLLALVLGTLLSGPLAAASEAQNATATLDGKAIALSDVAKYNCHDLASPTIRCFDSQAAATADAEEIADATAPESLLDGAQPLTIVVHCVWYWDRNYAGPSFTQAFSEPNMSVYGWDNAISAFQQLSTHQCRWYQYASYTGVSWTWGAGVDVPYVSDGANDKFSSSLILQ